MPLRTNVGAKVLNASFPDIRLASDHSILITFGDTISFTFHRQVRALFDALTHQHITGVTNLHPAYSSLLVSFDPRRIGEGRLRSLISSRLSDTMTSAQPREPVIEIPVCYEERFAPDLADVASLHNMDAAQVITMHTSKTYLVYFLGFSPGFPYLGDLPAELATPRLSTPRTSVAAGSVAIGGSQTGIYPIDSPGGWRIIGRTPWTLFHPGKNPPTLLQMGNVIHFVPITGSEYEAIRMRAQS